MLGIGSKCVRCKTGTVRRPNIEYCEECSYDLMGEEVEKHPIGGHQGAVAERKEPKK